MGVAISNNVVYSLSNVLAGIYPATDRIVGAYTLGASYAASIVNQVYNNAQPMATVGAPTISSLWMTCNRTNCFDTQIPDTLSRTFAAVARFPSSGNAAWMGDYQNAVTPSGDAIGYIAAGTTIRNYTALASTVGTNPQLNASAMTGTRFRVMIGTVAGTGLISGMTTWDDSGVLVAATTSMASRGAVSARTIRVGACYDTATFTGNVDIASAVLYNGALSMSEQAALRASFQAQYGSSLGNTL